jgi:hypothetical protein
MTSRSNPAVATAKRMLAARKGPPTEADVPPPTVFPGRKPVILPGQLALDREPLDREPDDERTK